MTNEYDLPITFYDHMATTEIAAVVIRRSFDARIVSYLHMPSKYHGFLKFNSPVTIIYIEYWS